MAKELERSVTRQLLPKAALLCLGAIISSSCYTVANVCLSFKLGTMDRRGYTLGLTLSNCSTNLCIAYTSSGTHANRHMYTSTSINSKRACHIVPWPETIKLILSTELFQQLQRRFSSLIFVLFSRVKEWKGLSQLPGET